MTSWEVWASGVLNGVTAPLDAVNVDTLWAWSNAETAPFDLMRWNNPLNTTLPWPGSIDQNSVGVKAYASIQDGISATVLTLGNGHYPVILANLRGSIPRQQWGNACANLGTWGTGCGWINNVYGMAPGDIVMVEMATRADSPDLFQLLDLLQLGIFGKSAADGNGLQMDVAAVKAELDAIKTATTSPLLDPTVAANLATVAALARKLGIP